MDQLINETKDLPILNDLFGFQILIRTSVISFCGASIKEHFQIACSLLWKVMGKEMLHLAFGPT